MYIALSGSATIIIVELYVAHSIEQYSSPRLSLPCEEVRELDGHDDRLLQGLFGHVESSDVVPVHVRFLSNDGSCNQQQCHNIDSTCTEER